MVLTKEQIKKREEQREYCRDLYASYVPRKEIAEEIGVSIATVWQDTRDIDLEYLKDEHRALIAETIHTRLEEIDRNQTWLAERLGMTRAAVSTYTTEKIIPPLEIREGICNELRIPRNSLEIVVED